MKKLTAILLCMALLLTLTGCLGTGEVDTPATVSDGTAWDSTWTNIGGFLGLEAPAGDFESFDTNGSLSGMEMYYASWVLGEPTPIDDDTSAYDAQIYFLLQSMESQAAAADALTEWRGNITGDFAITGERTITAAGQEFTLVLYTCTGENDHYGSGAVALGQWGSRAILVDMAAVDGLGLEPESILISFLEGFHYA